MPVLNLPEINTEKYEVCDKCGMNVFNWTAHNQHCTGRARIARLEEDIKTLHELLTKCWDLVPDGTEHPDCVPIKKCVYYWKV